VLPVLGFIAQKSEPASAGRSILVQRPKTKSRPRFLGAALLLELEMNGIFKTFWDNGRIRLMIVYCQNTGDIRTRRVFDSDGIERQPTAYLESKRTVDDVWDDIWPHWKYFIGNRQVEWYDAQSDYMDEESTVSADDVPEWDDYGNYGDYGYEDRWGWDAFEDYAFNSKYSDGW
jgi:hypothetical protein